METEPKLRLEDLRMEDSCTTTEPVKATDDDRGDGVGVDKPVDTEEMKPPDDVPNETPLGVIPAEAPEKVADDVEHLSTGSSTERSQSQSTNETVNAPTLPAAEPTTSEPSDVDPANTAEFHSPTEIERSSLESSAAVEDAKPTEAAILEPLCDGAADGDTTGNGASEEQTELERATAEIVSSEEITAVVDSATIVVKAMETVGESPPIANEPRRPVADGSNEAPNGNLAIALLDEEVLGAAVESSVESHADSKVETTQSAKEEQRHVPESRPDPPSEHGDDDDDEDYHAANTKHEEHTQPADDNDEMRVKDALTFPNDVKPDPPQNEKPKESELVVVVPDGAEETTPPLSVADTISPLPVASVNVEVKEDITEVLPVVTAPVAENQTDDRDDKMVDIVPLEVPAKRNTDNDDESYEEIIVEDDDEFIEYVDELLDESNFNDDDEEEEVFTEVTYDSQDLKDQNLVFGNNSRSSLTESRPVIKSATQKALEEEAASKKAEADEARRGIAFRIARQSSFSQKDEEYQRKLQVEEAEHIRQEEMRERLRILVQEQMARSQAEEAARHIAQQSEKALRKRLELEEEKRKANEVEEHRRAAEAAAREKETAEKARRQVEEAERNERDSRKKAMEEEVRLLEIKLAEAKLAADEAKRKEKEEKKRLQAKIDARRKEKKAERMSITSSMLVLSPTHVSSGTVDPSSPLRALLSPMSVPQSPAAAAAAPVAAIPAAAASEANGVYYSVVELRKQSVPGLDYKNREMYIHPNEYNALFGMPKSEFDQQPKWKKTQLKRKQKLF